MIAAIRYRREVWLILNSRTPACEASTGERVDLLPGEYLVTGRHQVDGGECYELEDAYVVEVHSKASLVVRTVPTPHEPYPMWSICR